MMAGLRHEDPDVAFVLGLIPQHRGAIGMARIQLAAGSDAENIELARQIIAGRQQEIDVMLASLHERGVEMPDSRDLSDAASLVRRQTTANMAGRSLCHRPAYAHPRKVLSFWWDPEL